MFTASIQVKHGKWSEILVIIIPEIDGAAGPDSLQNIWSISVPFFLENLVGKVIWGKRPLLTKRSKYSCIFPVSLIFNRFRLKSPHHTRVEFSSFNFLMIFEIGTRKLSMHAIVLLRPGLYMLAMVTFLGRVLSVISIKIPSQCLESLYTLRFLHVYTSLTYVISPPFCPHL